MGVHRVLQQFPNEYIGVAVQIVSEKVDQAAKIDLESVVHHGAFSERPRREDIAKNWGALPGDATLGMFRRTTISRITQSLQMSSVTLTDLPSLISLSPSDAHARPFIAVLVTRLRAHDLLLVERLVRELLPVVRKWLFRLLGPSPELDDAVQDALSEIASALHRFEGRSSVRTLAHTITLRTSYRHFRRRGAWDLELIDESFEDQRSSDPETTTLDREVLARVYGMLERLPAQRRAAFILCSVEGMAPAEAARIAGCSGVAMRSRLFHARAELDRMMSEDELLAPMVNGQSREGARHGS